MDAKTYCLNCIHKDVCGWYPKEFCSALLPSIPVEPFTDPEKRIFQAMVNREEGYCKAIDNLWRKLDIQSDIDLVPICKEIERKVKKALWTEA